MVTWIHIKEGLRMFKRRRYVAKHGLTEFAGDDKEICKRILHKCYDHQKGYFRVSSGHFKVFYTRDFGWIVKSLMKLGYVEEVRSTLRYALAHFKEHGRVRTSINPIGQVFDFPTYAADSLPYLMYSLSVLGDKDLVDEYRAFLENELVYFFATVVDPRTGLVVKDRHFSSMKDHAKRKSACYDNCMLYLLQQACQKLKFDTVLSGYDYEKLIVGHFWKDHYFLDDMSGKDYIAGDAQVFPFWTGAVKDDGKLKKVIATLSKHGFDQPLPLRYTHRTIKDVDIKGYEFFASGYEENVAWTHMGPLYVSVVGKVDTKLQKKYLAAYKEMILKYKTFLELLQPDGTPYHTFWYYTDEGMSWCANYLAMVH